MCVLNWLSIETSAYSTWGLSGYLLRKESRMIVWRSCDWRKVLRFITPILRFPLQRDSSWRDFLASSSFSFSLVHSIAATLSLLQLQYDNAMRTDAADTLWIPYDLEKRIYGPMDGLSGLRLDDTHELYRLAEIETRSGQHASILFTNTHTSSLFFCLFHPNLVGFRSSFFAFSSLWLSRLYCCIAGVENHRTHDKATSCVADDYAITHVRRSTFFFSFVYWLIIMPW